MVAGFTEARKLLGGLTEVGVGSSTEEGDRAEKTAAESPKGTGKTVKKAVSKAEDVAREAAAEIFTPQVEQLIPLVEKAMREGLRPQRMGDWMEDKVAKHGAFGVATALSGTRTIEERAKSQAVYALASSTAAMAPVWAAKRAVARDLNFTSAQIDGVLNMYLPFVDALGHGLQLYWITSDEVIAVGRNES